MTTINQSHVVKTQKISALFVESDGSYYGIPNVDCWDKDRDARLFVGSNPIVAHPPCNLWVNFAALNYKRYGGEHNRPGNDGGCFLSALESLRRCGGVLEHPAFSHAWMEYDLPRPIKGKWIESNGLWVCEVWQSAYGHLARKRTWLLYSGKSAPFELNWSRVPGSHQCGWFDRTKPTLSKKQASATPKHFRDTLLSLARHSATLSEDSSLDLCDSCGDESSSLEYLENDKVNAYLCDSCYQHENHR